MTKKNRLFPESVSMEHRFDAATEEALWKVSRQCVDVFNQALALHRQDKLTAEAREKLIDSTLAGQPEASRPARSVFEFTLRSLDESLGRYAQAEQDFTDQKRGDVATPLGNKSEAVFFPLFYTQAYIQLGTDCLFRLLQGENWCDLQLPPGDYQAVNSVLIRYHKDSDEFMLELNPVFENIKLVDLKR